MYQTTLITWILIIFGTITCIPLLIAQLIILFDPEGKRAKDILIGKGEEWRDKTHFKSAYSLAMVDWIIFAPLFILSVIGMLTGNFWGYLLFSVSGAIQLYINGFLWFFEKEYVYPSIGPLKYYTYYWGNFIYWGVASLLYGIARLNGSSF
ncbi:hypothetical protein ACFL4H_02135 [Candidatus Neomarinimicrobiota bacterium]